MQKVEHGHWYKNAVIYGLDISTFYDSNGDGVGDFKGATEKLPYLQGLGITCIWLLPFFPSPDKDNGYDVADYYNVDRKFGTLDDFTEFISEAEKHNIKVIIDLIFHHTSDQHPWFKASRQNRNSRYRPYYIWAKSPPFSPEKNVFNIEDGNTWHYDAIAEEHYHHRFYTFQPDLNLSNPDVQEEIFRVIDFWLNFKIYGFRLDAATFIIREKGVKGTKLKDPAAFLRKLNKFVRERNEEAVILTEADVKLEELDIYIGKGDEVHLLMNFISNNKFFLALARRNVEPLTKIIETLPHLPDNMQWANFIRNLDELNLGRLDDEERNEVFRHFAPNPRMQIYSRGIRRRITPMVRGNWDALKMIFSVIITMPGITMITYGDEIGMGDDLSQWGRNAVRTTMQWNDDENGGFSDAPVQNLAAQVISQGLYSYKHINVKNQENDQLSLLSFVRKMLWLRREWMIFGYGDCEIIKTGEPHILCLKYKHQAKQMLTLHNFSDVSTTVKLKGISLSNSKRIMADQSYEPAQTGEIVLSGYGFCWLEIREVKNKNKR